MSYTTFNERYSDRINLDDTSGKREELAVRSSGNYAQKFSSKLCKY